MNDFYLYRHFLILLCVVFCPGVVCEALILLPLDVGARLLAMGICLLPFYLVFVVWLFYRYWF